MALAQGDAYACISEVILLGLAGVRQHFSYGPLRAEKVQQIAALAKQYGFGVRVREG
jgi:predicted amino acid dehydrogenase